MLNKILFAAACSVTLLTTPIFAQESIAKSGSVDDWSFFKGENPTECWAASSPSKTVNTRNGQPALNVKRGDILLIVFYRPDENVKGQVAFTGGYPFAPGRSIKMEVDGKTYNLATKGEWAWPQTPEDDAKVAAAMRRGAKAVLTARSSRGTVTEDEFSLVGFTASLEKARDLCAN